jgi:hypothetical protein
MYCEFSSIIWSLSEYGHLTAEAYLVYLDRSCT